MWDGGVGAERAALPARVLLVDGDLRFAEAFARAAREHGVEVLTEGSVSAALSSFERCLPEWIIVDAQRGEALILALRTHPAAPKIFVLTAGADTASVVRAMRLGATSVLEKPKHILELLPHASEPREADGTLEEIAYDRVQRAMFKHRGNKTRAAKELGITRPGLVAKLKKLPPVSRRRTAP